MKKNCPRFPGFRICTIPKIESCSFTSNFDGMGNLRLKNQKRIVGNKNINLWFGLIRTNENFQGSRVPIWPFLLIFGSSYMKPKFKTQKITMYFNEKKKHSEVSKFSILPYYWNRKLGVLEKSSFTSSFDCFVAAWKVSKYGLEKTLYLGTFLAVRNHEAWSWNLKT